MKLIVLDFLRRWWWMLLGIMLATMLMTAFGRAPMFAPFMMICLLTDVMGGVLRVERSLPVPWRRQAQTWWFTYVLLLPLITILVIPAVIWACSRYSWHEANAQPWFAAAMGWWIELGLVAVLFVFSKVFFLSGGAGGRPPATGREICLSIAWSLAFPVCVWLMVSLPVRVENFRLWHGLLCVAVLPVLIWSFVTAPRMLQNRLSGGVPLQGFSDAGAAPGRPGPGGLVALIAMLHGRQLFMVIAFAPVTLGVSHLMGLDTRPTEDIFSLQWVGMAAMFVTISAEAWNLRSLRTLPMSTIGLSTMIISAPLVAGIAMGLMQAGTTLLGLPMPVPGILGMALATSAVGSLSIMAALHLSSRLRLILVLGMGILLSGGVMAAKHAFPASQDLLAVVEGLAIIVSVVLVWRGLRRCSAFYLPRQMPGGGCVPMG